MVTSYHAIAQYQNQETDMVQYYSLGRYLLFYHFLARSTLSKKN